MESRALPFVQLQSSATSTVFCIFFYIYLWFVVTNAYLMISTYSNGFHGFQNPLINFLLALLDLDISVTNV